LRRDAATGKVKQKFECQKGATLDVDWRDNESFASCSVDKSIYVCKLGHDQPVAKFEGHRDEVNAVKWDPTGSLLASCSDDCTAKVWSVDSEGKPKLDLHGKEGHEKEIYTIKWSPTGAGTANPDQPLLLATASFDKTVKVSQCRICLSHPFIAFEVMDTDSLCPRGLFASAVGCTRRWHVLRNAVGPLSPHLLDRVFTLRAVPVLRLNRQFGSHLVCQGRHVVAETPWRGRDIRGCVELSWHEGCGLL
jgi:transducin (beta)-like 1